MASVAEARVPDWNSLPGDIKRVVMDRLSLSDCVRLAQVSTAFRNAASKHASARESQAQAAAFHAQKRQRALRRIESMLRPMCCGRCIVWHITHWRFTAVMLVMFLGLATMLATGIIFTSCDSACGWKTGPGVLASSEHYRPGHSKAFPYTDANVCTVTGSSIQRIPCGSGGPGMATRVIFNVTINGVEHCAAVARPASCFVDCDYDASLLDPNAATALQRAHPAGSSLPCYADLPYRVPFPSTHLTRSADFAVLGLDNATVLQWHDADERRMTGVILISVWCLLVVIAMPITWQVDRFFFVLAPVADSDSRSVCAHAALRDD